MMMPTLTCWWSARRLDRYLDADPAAPLAPEEVRRLEHHVSVCSRCRQSLANRRRVRAALDRLGERRTPDAGAVRRLEQFATRLRREETR